MAEFKDRLYQAMSDADITQSQLARECNITQSSISDWLRGKYLAKQDKVDILAKRLHVSPAWLMGIDDVPAEFMPIEKKTLPLLGSVACGEPIWRDEGWQGNIATDADMDADFCLIAKGDSMINARIHDGDVVFIKQQSIVENGQIGVVLVENEATLKRIYYDKKNNIVQLVAENPTYPPLIYTNQDLESIRILGKAVAFQSRLN